jgi:HEAT repeat protein
MLKLKTLPKKTALSKLVTAVEAGDEDEIFKAALAVGDANEAAGVPILRKLLRNDARIRVKNGAAIGLRELRANEAVPDLVRLIQDPRYRKTRGTFVYALQTLELDSKDLALLRKLSRNRNFEVRSMARGALKNGH